MSNGRLVFDVPQVNCVIPLGFIDRVIRDARARDYEKADFYVIPCERKVFDVVTINLLPTRWGTHGSVITFACDEKGECFVEADIISRKEDVEYVKNNVEDLVTGEDWGSKVRSCKVISVHKHDGEYHSHVYCGGIVNSVLDDVVRKLIEIARDVEVEKSMHL